MVLRLLPKTNKSILIVFSLLIVAFTLLRAGFDGFNFSRFVVAGSDFVQADTEHPNIIINEGQGYDGQFFYRYAHNPLNLEKTAHGVTVDHIEYRIQRIFYPTIAFLLSFGGNEQFIPLILVLLNVLGFIGILWVSLKICEHYSSNRTLALLPLFLFGAFMALARDTSEIFEAFFFLLAVEAFIKNNLLIYVVFVIMTIFSRETSLIAIGPLSLVYGIKLIKDEGFNFRIIMKNILLFIPFILVVLWKYYLHTTIQSENLIDGSQNLSFPLNGIYYGAQQNFNFIDFKSIMETVFWFAFLLWNCWFIYLVIKVIDFKELFNFQITSMLALVYLLWGTFSLFLGPAIYVDDWGYVRIFTLWNLLGMSIIMIKNYTPNKWFFYFSSIILCFLLIRLIVRV
jgi:hypothetical protein